MVFGPANADAPGVGRLEAIGAGAHPVVGVLQADAAGPVGGGQLHRPGHGRRGVQKAHTALPVPLLDGPEPVDRDGFGAKVDHAAAARFHEPPGIC